MSRINTNHHSRYQSVSLIKEEGRNDPRSKHHSDIDNKYDFFTITCYYNLGGSWTIGFRYLSDCNKIRQHWLSVALVKGIRKIRIVDILTGQIVQEIHISQDTSCNVVNSVTRVSPV